MSVSPFDSAIYRDLLSDAEVAALFSDEAETRALLDVEAALALAQGELGIIPLEAAAQIAAAARGAAIAPEDLRAGAASAGVPVTALIAALRKTAPQAASHVHWGVTSQDIVDTALALRLKAACAMIETRLKRLARILKAQAIAHRRTVMAGRTRFQQAVPTTYGLKAAGWLSALCRHQARLAELSGRVFIAQLGGAAGTLASLDGQGPALVAAFAAQVGLGAPLLPWHTQRDGLAELAGWLSLVSGTLGKIGGDVLLLAQSEIGEARPASGGGSSAMPQKANPVAGEILLALARFNAAQLAAMHGALVQEHERGGSGWTLEWLVLPQMVLAAAAGLTRACELMEGLVIDKARMRRNVEATNGLIMAEAASLTLAKLMPRAEAEAIVGQACAKVAAEGIHLADALSALVTQPFDAAALRDPERYLGASDGFIDAVLAEADRVFKD